MIQRCIYYEECLKINYPVDPEANVYEWGPKAIYTPSICRCERCPKYTAPEETEEEMILQERRSE